MKRLIAIFAIALSLPSNAARSEEISPVGHNQKPLKNAEKVITYMGMVGIYDERVKKAAYYMDDHIDDGYFRIHEEKYAGFNMQLRYEMDMPSVHKFQLHFTNEEMPHWEVNGTTRKMMVEYKVSW